MFCCHLQDCLWAGRCIRRGWFLPYTPAEKEFGAWRNHYVACVSTLDWLTPREAAERYGTLNQQTAGTTEEEEERRKERRIRQMIRDKLQEEKGEWEEHRYSKCNDKLHISDQCVVIAEFSMRMRRPWGSYTKPPAGGSKHTERTMFSSWPSVSWSSSLCLSLDKGASMGAGVEEAQASSSFR